MVALTSQGKKGVPSASCSFGKVVSCARDGPRCLNPAGFDLASEIDLMMPRIRVDGSHSSSYGFQRLLACTLDHCEHGVQEIQREKRRKRNAPCSPYPQTSFPAPETGCSSTPTVSPPSRSCRQSCVEQCTAALLLARRDVVPTGGSSPLLSSPVPTLQAQRD